MRFEFRDQWTAKRGRGSDQQQMSAWSLSNSFGGSRGKGIEDVLVF